jgi:hypothetical protein
MAAQYTEVTLEDMERFLKRGYRALRPQQGVQRNEYYYDLMLSPNVAIRVMTSVHRSSGMGAGVGEDAIRVLFYGTGVKRPLVPGKAPIVKRTQNWRNSLQNKIEDVIELYEEKAAYWESRAGNSAGPEAPAEAAPSPAPPTPTPPPAPPRSPSGPPPSDKQVNFIKLLMSRANVDDLEAEGLFIKYRELAWPFNADNIRSMSMRRVSQLIDDLVHAVGYQRRYAAGDPAEYENLQ